MSSSVLYQNEKQYILDFLPYLLHKQIVSNNQREIYKESNFDSSLDLSDFHSRVNEILDFIEVENNTRIYLLYMIKRLNDNAIYLSTKNIYHVFFISLLISLKFLEDSIIPEQELTEITGISSQKMSELESEALNLLSYELHLSTEKFDEICKDYMI